jgi:hypothetical protein
MDAIATKLIQSPGVPWVLVTVVYFIWKQKIISVVKASDTEVLVG